MEKKIVAIINQMPSFDGQGSNSYIICDGEWQGVPSRVPLISDVGI